MEILELTRGRFLAKHNLLSLGYLCLYFPFMRFLTLLFITRKNVSGVKIIEIFVISELNTVR